MRRCWSWRVMYWRRGDRFLGLLLPRKSCIISEALGRGVRTFWCGNGSARGIGVCTILGREETRKSRSLSSAHTNRRPGGWVVTNCCMELVGKQELVNVGVWESRREGAYQCRRIAVCFCGKRHRPVENAVEEGERWGVVRREVTFANLFLFGFFIKET